MLIQRCIARGFREEFYMVTHVGMEATQKLLDEALLYYEQKNYAGAERVVDALIKANPVFHRGWFLKGIIMEETGKVEEAKEYLLKSGDVHSLMVRLAMQLQEKDPQRARVYFDRVLSEDPGSNILLFQNGLLCEKTGDRDGAHRFYQRLSPAREILSRIIIPIGFMIFLVLGAIMIFNRGERALSGIVMVSSLVCLFWLKRDGGLAIQMLRKKRSFH
jgi:tetratricopeptide (TPR) repeat protein